MRIYVDFDDCLCETGRYFARLAAERFGRNVPYAEMRVFELDKTFSLTDREFQQMMAEGHTPEALLSFAETPGASETLNSWLDRGWEVSVITGRPFEAFGPSREWLDSHGLERVPLYCFNKYNRDSFYRESAYSLQPEDYYRIRFDFAVEDSPRAFRFFDHLPELQVLVFDRPWNRDCAFPRDGYRRCFDWQGIRESVP